MQFISRAQWGALPPDHTAREENGFFHPQHNPGGWLVYTRPLTELLNTLVIHHSAEDAGQMGVREIQRLHIEQNGWADIGYHFVIDGVGIGYEARPLTVRGVHVRAANTGTVGIVLLGNFEINHPRPAQLDTLEQLVAFLVGQYPGLTHLAAHADFNEETVCPGRNMLPWLRPLALRHYLQYGTEGYQMPTWSQ
ncbi:MAG: peptidoglycan recognition protein family protein [Anaerolineae bacterium]|nr:peptidoglycan recognition protein family protein [Anaerolineae bacterium]